jgi:hypothetical protein
VAETEALGTGGEVEPVVASQSHGDGGVLSAVAVRVADEGHLPVGVELALPWISEIERHNNRDAYVGDSVENLEKNKPRRWRVRNGDGVAGCEVENLSSVSVDMIKIWGGM